MALLGSDNSVEVQIDGDSSGLESAVVAAKGSLSNLKTAALGVSAALGALATGGLAASTKAAADFDSAMTESLAIMGDVSTAMEEDMADAAREVATQTRFSANQAAESYFFLASAGLDAKESIASLPEVAEFAQAGMFDMARATDILTDAQSALGLSTDELAGLSDQLVKANTLANASVEQFGESLINKAAPAMQRMGVETTEGISALATFADQGLKGRRAGTIFARTLEDLGEKANSNEKAFRELGIQVFDSNGEMRNLADITQDVEESLGDMSTAQKTAAIQQLGLNRRSRQGIDLLMGNSEQLRTYQSELNNAGGTAEEVANKQLEDLNSQLGIAFSILKDIAIEIGDVFLPRLTDMVESVNGVLKKFRDWNEASDGVQGAMGLVATAVSAAAGILLRFVGGPVTLVISALVTLAGAFGTNFKDIRTTVISAMKRVSNFIENTMTRIRENYVKPVLNAIEQAWGEHGQQILMIVERRFNEIKNGIKTAITAVRQNVVKPILGNIESDWRGFGDVLQTITETDWSGIALKIDTEITRIQNEIITPAINEIERLWNEHGQRIAEDTKKNWVKALKNQLVVLNRIKQDVIRPYIETVEGLWQTHGEDLLTETKETYNLVRNGIRDTLNFIRNELIQPYIDFVEGYFNTHGEEIVRIATETYTRFKNMISEQLTFIKEELIKPTIQTYEALWKTHGEDLVAEFQETWQMIATTIDENLTFIREEVVTPFLNWLLPKIETALDLAFGFWDAHGEKIMTVMEFAFDTILGLLETFADAFLTAIRFFLNVVQGDWEEAWTVVREFVERTLDRIIGFAKEWGGRFLDWLGGLVDDIIGWFKDLASRLIGNSIVPDMLNDILGAFKSFGRKVISTVKDKLGGVVSAFQSKLNTVRNLADDIIGKARGAANRVADLLGEARSDANEAEDIASGGTGGGENESTGSTSPSSGNDFSSGTSPSGGGGTSGTTTPTSGTGASSGSGGGGSPSGSSSGTVTPFQHGGVVNAPESGVPAVLHGSEAIMPLDRIKPLMAEAVASAVQSTDRGGREATTEKQVVFKGDITVQADNPDEFVEEIRDELRYGNVRRE